MIVSSSIIENTDFYRVDVQRKLDAKKRSLLGQFMTPAPIARYMAGLFENIEGEVSLLDPGAGVGSLTAAFVDEIAVRQNKIISLQLTAYEIERVLQEYLEDTLLMCSAKQKGKVLANMRTSDFIEDAKHMIEPDLLTEKRFETFSHILMNPPYKKINSNSEHRSILRSLGIETSNLYTAFMALSIRLLRPGGEMVAIVPRSFCNGPYFLPFRENLLTEMAINQIHVFDTRNKAFRDDDVLQEIIIIHATKGKKQRNVIISSSNSGAFTLDRETSKLVSEDLSIRIVDKSLLVSKSDPQKFIRIAPSRLSENVAVRMKAFTNTLEDLGIKVSTGPVVDFRMRKHIHKNPVRNSVPLLYATHLASGSVIWPKESKKPNAIMPNEDTNKWLMPNQGCYILTKRFTSKEEQKRVVATVYDGELAGSQIGFENHLNVFHKHGYGMSAPLAHGVKTFLNSTLLDKHFREFNGHTQVNATDLRSIRYPNQEFLERVGRLSIKRNLTQDEVDELLEKEILTMIDTKDGDPLIAHKKIDEALTILKALGLPRAQQNERSALTLLAILNLTPKMRWSDAERPMIGITPIMEFCADVYGKQYAPNTRETFRRQTMHQFVDGAVAVYNPDEPSRPVNSPKACYQISPDAYEVILSFGKNTWDTKLAGFLSSRKTLREKYANERDMEKIPVTVAKDKEIELTPGIHSQLIKNIIAEFAPRYAPGSEVIYVGDTGEKVGYFEEKRLKDLGVEVDRHGKMPDVVLYFKEKNWLLLIEAVTSHGPVDGKRHGELKSLFKESTAGIVYVTTFPDRVIMGRYLTEISWETEVWVAEAPTHMIHFDGERFLGPYE